MTRGWLRHLSDLIAAEGCAVRVTIIRADGSAPRDVGSAMTVGRQAFTGTIGGGALELQALREARALLAEERDGETAWHRTVRDFPLGPALGQCCGGYVHVLFERITDADVIERPEGEDLVLLRPLSGGPWQFARHRKDDQDTWPLPVRAHVREILSGARPREAAVVDGWYVEPMDAIRQPLFLYGAGHVGRAVVKVLTDLPFEIYWVDTDTDRYPDTVPDGVQRLVSADPADAARHAPKGAWHVIMTYSHAIDFDICQAVLGRGDYGYAGVIASKTKRARFTRRLREAGITEAAIADLHAPIGLAGLDGKEPAVIAVSLAADFLLRLQQGAAASRLPQKNEARGGS